MNTARPSRQILPLDSLEGPALPLSAAEVERMARTIARHTGSPSRARRNPGRLVGPGWRVGMAVAIVAGSAAALYWIPRRSAQPETEHPAATPRAAPVLVPDQRHGEGRVPAVRPTAATAEPLSPAPSVKLRPSGSPSDARASSTEPSVVPAQWLAHANELRRAQQWAPAAALYERILRQFPTSAEAYSATVAAASLRLEKLGDPTAARRLFRQALRSPGSGALDEEILWGLARADRVAGDPRAERAMLERLLAAHPRTLHAPYAQARLRELAAESR